MFSKSKTTTASKPAAMARNTTPSIVSAGLTITGDLRTEGEVQVDGTVVGDIACGKLVVGEGASVQGEISADDVDIRGEVTGRIRGARVALARSARVIGDIWHSSLSMEAGAHLEGQVRNSEDPRNIRETPAPKLFQAATGRLGEATVAKPNGHDTEKAAASA